MNASRNYIKNSQSKRKTRKNIEQKKRKFLANEEKSAKNKSAPSDQVTQFSRHNRGGSSGECLILPGLPV